jgi:exopolyphosphatase/guanosine-5'-triphosphate,3'-diphosphate pyrophosphatase
MMIMEKYGGIDIGSNAIRLLIATATQLDDKPIRFKKTSLVRVPIRLGADVFLNGSISELNIKRMIDAMDAYRLLLKNHKVIRYRACATSAMREACNGLEVVERIKQATGIQIEIIDGEIEADIIAATDFGNFISTEKSFLYVDVGGGSTEFTLYSQGRVIDSKSFKLGTVRILNDMVRESIWDEVKAWITQVTANHDKINVIGSGGNINSIYTKSGKKIGKPLSYFFLVNYFELLKSMTYHERIYELEMNPDRADVIIPATKIYLSAMKWSRAKNMYVPKIGLADGMVKRMFQDPEQGHDLSRFLTD